MSKAILIVLGSGNGSGSIAGLQAALDLANSGLEVYLVEEAPFLNGHVEILPRLFLEAVKHPNIQLLTQAEVTQLQGERGDFQVELQHHPRYVDMAKCTACGECIPVCPVTVQPDSKTAIYKPDSAVPSIFAIEKRGPAPCKVACPAGIHVQGYVALIAQGKFAEALALIREAIPFPGICGRVCNHPCEAACRRAEHDEPIAIEYLKRFVADYEASQHSGDSASQSYDATALRRYDAKKVAIVGSGPAGLTAAHFLAREGHSITVFEALPVAGGMMAVGIPDYRLPRDVLQSEIKAIEDLGVEIRTNTTIGPNGDLSLDDLRRDYDAVFVAVGAHGSRRLNVEGEDMAGVLHGVDFLREVNLGPSTVSEAASGRGREVAVGEKVLVIGGGNVAIDSAMVARRLEGRQVAILYRRSREEMPADPWEIEEAEEEGIAFQFLTTPTRVLGANGRVTGLECLRMELGEPDKSGRRRPLPIPGSEFTVEADTVIVAIGQTLEAESWKLETGNWIAVDPLTLATDVPGVFAGGDAVTGPATAIEAIAAGKRAAESILRYIRGEDLATGRTLEPPDISGIEYYTPPVVEPEVRAPMPKLSLAERVGFAETNLGFSEEEAVAEAARCLSCGVCSECLECVKVCEPQAIDHAAQGERLIMDVAAVILANGCGNVYQLPQQQGVYSVEPEDVLEASAIAAKVMADLAAYRTFPSAPSFPTLSPIPSRTGVFVCRCGGEIGDVVDVDAVVAEARRWPGVAFAQSIPFACHEEEAEAIQQAVLEVGLDRVVLAACSCCSLDQVCDSCTYQRVRCKLKTESWKLKTGFEFVNIREQCAWVHATEPDRATTKARDIIASAVAKVQHDGARTRSVVPLDKSVLVIGNGMASAVCADALTTQGFRVFRSEAPPLTMSGSLGNYTAVMPEPGGELRVGAIVLLPADEGGLEIRNWILDVSNRGVFTYRPDDGQDAKVWGMVTASRVAALLGKGWAVVEPVVAQVDPARCRACGTCQEICELHAVRVRENGQGVLVAQVDEAACQGCGTCVAHCPSGAITAGYSTDRQIEAMLVELIRL